MHPTAPHKCSDRPKGQGKPGPTKSRADAGPQGSCGLLLGPGPLAPSAEHTLLVGGGRDHLGRKMHPNSDIILQLPTTIFSSHPGLLSRGRAASPACVETSPQNTPRRRVRV